MSNMSSPTNSGKNVFVGNLPWTVTSDDLALYFGTVGRVKSVNITRFPETGRSKGWGIIEFEDKLSAQTAVQRYNMTEFMSRTIHVRLDRVTAEVEESSTAKVFVGNIPWDIGSNELSQHFRNFPSLGIQLVTNMSGRSRGFALIEYATKEEAERAMNEMNLTLLGGREIQCRLDRGPGRESELEKKSEPLPSLFVRGLNSKFTDELLLSKFAPFGEIVSVKVMRNASGLCKGWGTVQYVRMDNAQAAVDHLNGTPLSPGLPPCEVRFDKKSV